MKNEFENLLSLKEAADMWKMDESVLRKAIKSGKLKENIDAKKFGKQWVVSKNAMNREYGMLMRITWEIEYKGEKLRQVYFFESEVLSRYCQTYGRSAGEVSGDFTKLNLWQYLYDCYDYLHLGSIDDIISEISTRIRKGLKYA